MIDRYAFGVFRSGKADRIDAMLRNGLDPNTEMKAGEEKKPVEAYYFNTTGSRIVDVKQKAPRTLIGKVGNNPSGLGTYNTQAVVPAFQHLGLEPIPKALKTIEDAKLYLRAKGYPDDGLQISKRAVPYYVEPLDIAIHKGNMALISQLLKYGADISKSRWAERPVAVRRDDVIYPLLTLKQQNWARLIALKLHFVTESV